uniref:BRCT domain-containing protein n=1 Tax=Macrostomum lignano TaxID=282301 RepID=A0A1I8F5N5_9PLAT
MSSLRIPQRLRLLPSVTSTMASDCVVPASQASPMPQQQQRQPANPHRAAMDSPSVFLNSGYRPRFDLQALSAALRSPVPGPPAGTPDSVQRNIRQTCRAQGKRELLVLLPPPSSAAAIGGSANSRGPAAGGRPACYRRVTVYLSARLRRPAVRLAQLAESLGARSRWQWDPRTCTHLVAEGPPSDDPELQRAMRAAAGRHCLGASAPTGQPGLAACSASGCDAALDERDYPPTSASSAAAAPASRAAASSSQAPSPSPCASGSAAGEASLPRQPAGAEQQARLLWQRRRQLPRRRIGGVDVAGANVNDIGGASAGTGGAVVPRRTAGWPRIEPASCSNPSRTSRVCVGASVAAAAAAPTSEQPARPPTVASSVAANAAAAATAAVRPNEPLLVVLAGATPTRTEPRRRRQPPLLSSHAGARAAGASSRSPASALRPQALNAAPRRTGDRPCSASIRGLGGSPASHVRVEDPQPPGSAAALPAQRENSSACVSPPAAWVLRRWPYPRPKAGRLRLPREPYEWRRRRRRPLNLPDAQTRASGRPPARRWAAWRCDAFATGAPPCCARRTSWPASGRLLEAGVTPSASAATTPRLLGHPVRRRLPPVLAENRLHRRPPGGREAPEPAAYRLPQARKRQQGRRAGGQQRRSGRGRLQRRDFDRLQRPRRRQRRGGARTRSSKRDSAPLRFWDADRLWPAGGAGSSSGAAGGGSGFTRAARIVLAPPDFQVNPSLLIDSYLEWPVRLLGSLSGVRSNRGHQQPGLPAQLGGLNRARHSWQSLPAVDAMLSLSVSGLRLERRVQPQQQQQPPAARCRGAAPSSVSQLLSCGLRQGLRQQHLLAPAHYSPRCPTQEPASCPRQCPHQDPRDLRGGPPAAAARLHGGHFGILRPRPRWRCFNIRRRPFDIRRLRASAGGGHSGSGVASGDSGRAGGGGARTATDSNATPVTSTASSPVIGRRDNPQEAAVSSLAGSLASSLSRQELVTFGQLFRAWSSGASSFRWQRPASAGAAVPAAAPPERSTCCWACGPSSRPGDHQAFDEFLHDRGLRPTVARVSIGSTASSVRSRDSSEVDLDQALGSIVAQVQRLDMSQQQFAQPSLLSLRVRRLRLNCRPVARPAAQVPRAGRTRDSASMVAPADSGEVPSRSSRRWVTRTDSKLALPSK